MNQIRQVYGDRLDNPEVIFELTVALGITCHECQRNRMSSVASPKILRPSDFAPTMTTPLRVPGSSDFDPPAELDVAALGRGDDCGLRQPHCIPGDGAGIAGPRRGELRPHAHREACRGRLRPAVRRVWRCPSSQ